MANQFYYQIVDNTLYYGANEWEGASLLSRYDSSCYFYMYDLHFSSMLPHDDSIVVLENIDSTSIFMLYRGAYKTLDFTHFTIKQIGYNWLSFSGPGSGSRLTVDELGLPDGIETCGTFWPYFFTINNRIFSVKYPDNYIPDMYSLNNTSYKVYSEISYGIQLGSNIKSLSIGYIPPLDMGPTSTGYSSYFIYAQGLTSLEFRTKIVWPWNKTNDKKLGGIYTSVKNLDLSNLYIELGSRYKSGITCYVLGDTVKIPNAYGLIGAYDESSKFVNNYRNIEIGNLFNLKNTAYMFKGSTNTETVKLGGINNLINTTDMFYNCSSLTTIYASEFGDITTSDNMFYGCNSLVGGNGTVFNSSKTDASMAHVDRNGQEGYFTYNKATDYYKVIIPQVMDSIQINYPYTQFSKGDNVSITFTGYSKDTTLDYWLQYDPTTKRYKNIGSQNPLNFEILADTALIPIVKKGTPSAVYNVDLTAVPSNSCTLAGAGAYTAGDDVVITANPNEGYVFKQWEELINETWIILSYDKEYTLKAIGRDRTIRAVCVEDTSEEVVEITLSLKGGSGSLEGAGKYVKGTKATIKVNVGSRSVFKSWNLPNDSFVVSTQNPYTFTVVKTIEYQAILADNPYGGGGATEEGGGNGEFNDYIDFTPIPPLNLSATNTDLLSIYTLDRNGVNELAKFIYSDIFDATYQEKLSSILKLFGDVMDQIVSFGIVPFTVAGKASNIMPYLDIHAPVHCKIPYSQYITINCGTKKIGNYWNNFLDYSPYTKYELYLPFIGYKEIDADEIVNKNLSIKYRVDILTGDLVCFITIDERVRYQFGGNCLISLPLNSSAKDTGSVISGVASLTTAVGGLLLGSGTAAGAGIAGAAVNLITDKQSIKHGSSLSSSSNYLGLLNPVLYITRPRQNVPADYGKIKGYPSNITTKLKDLNGYTVIDEIHLENMSATDDEIDEIETLLKQGVIIN